MNGRVPIHCHYCGHVVAYVSEIAANQARRAMSMNLLSIAQIERRATEAAALGCCECEAKRIAAEAVTKTPTLGV